MDRLEYQRQKVADTTGIVLNIASKEDPANLKVIFGDRVINADISEIDTDYNRPLNIDVLMDCREPWPFDDNFAELVVMAEIIEHLYILEATAALAEASRVAEKLVLTLPYDFTLPMDYKGKEVWEHESGARGHCSGWTKEGLSFILNLVGWKVKEWLTVDYGIMGSARLDGYLIFCERIKLHR